MRQPRELMVRFVRLWSVLSLLAFPFAECHGMAEGVNIKGPTTAGNLVAGNSVAFYGNMKGARIPKSGGGWIVKYPTVSVEFWYDPPVEGGVTVPTYLITSTLAGMGFPNPTNTGTWSGTLTIQQFSNMVNGYRLKAIPINSEYEPDGTKSDSVGWFAVVPPE